MSARRYMYLSSGSLIPVIDLIQWCLPGMPIINRQSAAQTKEQQPSKLPRYCERGRVLGRFAARVRVLRSDAFVTVSRLPSQH